MTTVQPAAPALDRAWARYRETLEEQRRLLLSQSWANDPQLRIAAHAVLLQMEAQAYNLIIAPRTDNPVLYLHPVYSPVLYDWGNGSVDFNYRYGFADGSRSYRLYGRRGTSRVLDIQIQAGFFGGAGEKTTVASSPLDEFVGADGTFDIVLSAEPRQGAWLPLERSSTENWLLVREMVADWEGEELAELHLECLDDTRGLEPLTETELAERIDRAGRFIESGLSDFVIKRTRTLLDTVDVNTISGTVIEKNTSGVHPSAFYPVALFEVDPGEALIVETEIPQARFWNVQLTDLWRSQIDYTARPASLNTAQAALDPDGRFRAVIAHEDPGVPNWLDPTGRRRGLLQFRFFFFDRPVEPTIRRVPLDEVREHLPESTPHVTPAERREQLVRRRRAAFSRYGY